jgi:DNA polymerase-3 subunit delta
VRVFVFVGDDDFLVTSAAREQVNTLCPEADQAFGLELVDGAADNADEAQQVIARVLSALQTVGFFGGGKVVWLKDASFLDDSQTGRAVAVKERVEWLTNLVKKGLSDGQQLVISTPRIDGRSAFAKACKTHAHVKEFKTEEKSREADKSARERAVQIWKDLGLKPERSDVMENFLGRSGNDTRQIMQESEKLFVYMGAKSATVSVEDVKAVVSCARESVVWDLSDALGERKLGKALVVLRQLLFQGEEPIGLIFQLERRLRDLILVKECMRRKWLTLSGSDSYARADWSDDTEADATLQRFSKDPRKMHWYQTILLCRQARTFTLRELLQAQAEVAGAHESLVSGGLPGGLLMELLLIKITPKAAA